MAALGSVLSLSWVQVPVIEITDDDDPSRGLKLSEGDLKRLRESGVFNPDPPPDAPRPTGADPAFLNLPLVKQWTISALLIEADTIFAGLVDETTARSGGLMRFHRHSTRVTVYSVPDPIHTLVRVAAGLFMGTTRGAYILKDGAFARVECRRRPR
jgi:hypothetical protein